MPPEQPQGEPAGAAGAPPPDPATLAAPAATATAAPPPSTADLRVPCPRCGEPAQPGQEICLNCGALVGRSYRRPPSWRVPAALAALGVLLIGAGAGFGVAELTHGKDKKKPISLTPSRPVTPSTTATTPPPAATTTTQPTSPTTTGTTPTTPQTATLTTWPAGTTGWTVVLTTMPDRNQAEARARSAAGQQISAGVLKGSDYRGFKKTEWVVFMGQYDSKSAAARAGKGYAKKGFPGKPEQIRPKKK
ncbi:MAG: hypothetical protein QOI65_121 [Thermoleophilaceae bacterium]|jgi:hypothetical protein|nr:hypothetical protein [Thermoleophilaceae bacterium]